MKTSFILLILLFLLCVSLPFIFNVKYHENFASYPSESDLHLTSISDKEETNRDGSNIDISSTVIEPMTNKTETKETKTEKVYSYNDDVYSSYENLIDEEFRKKGHSLSDYLRKNPPNETNELKNKLDSDLTVISFLKDLTKQTEGFTSTHKLTDEVNKKTYDLLPNQHLYNNDGELKLETHDSTDYGALLDKVKGDFEDLKKKYDSENYVTKGDIAAGLDEITQKISKVSGVDVATDLAGVVSGVNAISMAGSNSGSMAGINSGSMAGSNSANIDISTNMISNNMSNNTTITQMISPIKCIADNGTPIGASVCCGQEGTLEETKYICPNTMPTCSGYKCGSNFGTCS